MATAIQTQYFSMFALFLMGTITVVGFKLLNWAFAPKRKLKDSGHEQLSVYVAYECGEVPVGSGQHRFNFQYYVFGLVFVIFDVITAFLFSWALIIRDLKVEGLVIAGTFLAIFLIGFGYWWRRNELRWM
ncbi:MAG: NADH-quinone oxidoreductase subunit A [Methanobacteriota archaeon]|nr:MAG: NADH-quinone oxidoreductase subunit A [Euryarchaeota archaeon]